LLTYYFKFVSLLMIRLIIIIFEFTWPNTL